MPSPLPSSTLTLFAAVVRHGQVGLAVAVEVAHRHRRGVGADGVGDLRLEGAVAVAQEHADGVGAGIGDGEVGLAVAVEVAQAIDRSGPVPRSCRLTAGWKVPSPLPSSTLTVLSAVVGDGEVELAVTVEVAHGNRQAGY